MPPHTRTRAPFIDHRPILTAFSLSQGRGHVPQAISLLPPEETGDVRSRLGSKQEIVAESELRRWPGEMFCGLVHLSRSSRDDGLFVPEMDYSRCCSKNELRFGIA